MPQAKETLIYETGVMKLADFGLSKTLPINKHASFDLESKFKLTGETGSYRYMAPEVFRHEPYNYKARGLLLGLICQWLKGNCAQLGRARSTTGYADGMST